MEDLPELPRQDSFKPILVNKIIEDENYPENWKEVLKSYDDRELRQQYEASLVWLSATRFTDEGSIEPIGLSVQETDRLNEVLSSFREEVASRVDEYMGKSYLTYEQLVERLSEDNPEITNVGFTHNELPKQVTDYIIFDRMIVNREEFDKAKAKLGFNNYIKFAKKNNSFARAAKYIVPLSVVSMALLASNIFSPSTQESDHASKSIENRPGSVMASDQYLIRTAVSLPEGSSDTLQDKGAEFDRADVEKIKESTYILYIDSTEQRAACSTTLIARNNNKIALLLARHCLSDLFSDQFKLAAMPSLWILNPRNNEFSKIIIDSNSIIFNEGQRASDVAAVVGTLDDKDFDTQEFGWNIIPDFENEKRIAIMIGGYPSLLQPPNVESPIFLAGEGNYKSTRSDSSFKIANGLVSINPVTIELMTPNSPGASGGAALIKSDSGLQIMGVISYGRDALISVTGRVLSSVTSGVAPIPSEILDRAKYELER